MMLVLAAAMAGCAHRAPDGRGAATATPGPPAPELLLPVFPSPATPRRSFARSPTRWWRRCAGPVSPGAALGILTDRREEHATFRGGQCVLVAAGDLEHVVPDRIAEQDLHRHRGLAADRRAQAGSGRPGPPVPARPAVARPGDHRGGDRRQSARPHGRWYGDEIVDTGDGPYALARYVDTRLPELPQLFRCGEFFSTTTRPFSCWAGSSNWPRRPTITRRCSVWCWARPAFGQHGPASCGGPETPHCDGHTAIEVNGRQTVAVQTLLWPQRRPGRRDLVDHARRAALRPFAPRPARPKGTDHHRGEPHGDAGAGGAGARPGVVDGRSWFVQGRRRGAGDLPTATPGPAHRVRRGAGTSVRLRPLLLNGQPGAAAGLAALEAAPARHPRLRPLSGRVGPLQALLAPEIR